MKAVTLLFSVMTMSGVWAGMEERSAVLPQASAAGAMKAAISGVEQGGIYGQIPPVLVELERVPPRAAFWVELYRGPARQPGRGVTVKSRLVSCSGGKAILDVPGICRAAEAAGAWTVVVMAGTGLDVQAVAHATFQVRAGARAGFIAGHPATLPSLPPAL